MRADIPILLAALGPKSVEQAAEIADGWSPMFFLPEASEAAFGTALAAGRAKRPAERGDLDISVQTKLLISDRPEEIEGAESEVRQQLALYLGGMGARGANFYHELVALYGFAEAADEVQDLFLAGRKAEAEAALPAELVRGVSLIGPAEDVQGRVAAHAAAGVTSLNVAPLGATHEDRVRDLAVLGEYARVCAPRGMES